MFCAECVPEKQTNSRKKLLEVGGGREDFSEEAMIAMNPASVRTWKAREKVNGSWQDPESEQK